MSSNIYGDLTLRDLWDVLLIWIITAFTDSRGCVAKC